MVNMVCRVKRQVDMLLMQKSMTVSAREEPEEAIFLQVHWGCEALEGDFRDVRLKNMQLNLLHSTSETSCLQLGKPQPLFLDGD